MDARENDHIGLNINRLASKRKTVANNIRYAMKNFRGLVIMRENNCIPLALEFKDCRDIVFEPHPFSLRQHRGYAIIKL
ncbi:hypothetical protein D9M72_535400 [compost metagenome]